MMKNNMKKEFTLVEILLIIAVIGLLSSAILAFLNESDCKADTHCEKTNQINTSKW